MVTKGESRAAATASAALGVLKKGPWAAAEDMVLTEYVKKHGEGNWNAVQGRTGLQRCGKSCRLRWTNHLRPNLKKCAFSPDEELLIIDLQSKLGNKWAHISSHLPGRTDNDIKNYWNTRMKRKLKQGLPLYPNQNNSIQSQTSKIHPLQPPTLPFSLQKNAPNDDNNPPNNMNNNTLSLLNPLPLSSPLFTVYHPHPYLTPYSLNRCSNSYMGRPAPPPSQTGSVGVGSRFDVAQVPSTWNNEGLGVDFPNNNFELPSNQLNQNVASDPAMVEVVKAINNCNNNNLNVGQTKSGLLDDLLQEAKVNVGGGRGLKRERNEDCELQWDISTPEKSSTGIKKLNSEEQQMNFENDDLSNIVNLIPSLVQVPGWSNEEGAESPVGRSSVISTDDNYE